MSEGDLLSRRHVTCVVVPCVITVDSPSDSPIASPSPLLNGDASSSSSSNSSCGGSRPCSTDPSKGDGGDGSQKSRSEFPAADDCNSPHVATAGAESAGPVIKDINELGAVVDCGAAGGTETKRRPPLTRGISRNKSDPKILPVILFAHHPSFPLILMVID